LFNCIFPKKHTIDAYLVNDGCTDGTPEMIKEKFPQVRIIQGDGNLFWNRGMHLAWETAAKTQDYDYYLWLNDDTVIYPHAIEKLIICSQNENNQKIITGSTCSSDDKNKITYGGKLLKKGTVKPNGQKQHCDYFNGNIVLIPKYVYEFVGKNDRLFHHALGDFDYGLRAKKSGIESIIAPSVLGECDEHKDLLAWCNPKTPILKRLKLHYTPLGNHPVEFFKYEKRHNGLLMACFHFCTSHLRVLIPELWKIK
jgi:GT2 family glycosyltransferase